MNNPFLDDATQTTARNPFLDDEPAATQPAPRNYSLGEVPVYAAANFLPNAAKTVKDVAGAVYNDPVGVAKNVAKLGIAAGELAIPGRQKYENEVLYPLVRQTAGDVGITQDQQGLHFDPEQAKRYLAERPFEALLNASIGTRGVSAPLQIAGKIAKGTKAGAALTKTGEMIGAVDPLTGAAKTAKNVAPAVMGGVTGVGMSPIKEALSAAYAGGQKYKDFLQYYKGADPATILPDVDEGLKQILADRSAAYKSGMAGVKADPAVLDFKKIDATLSGANPPSGVYRGRSGAGKEIIVNPEVKGTVEKIKSILDEWRGLDPAEYHTPEGFDQLKQSLDAVRDATKPGTAADKLATQVRNIVKDQITAQAPGYAKVMADYSRASDLANEIKRTLAVNPNATVDTKLRKLLSAMRDNVNTNYGQRLDTVKKLEEASGKNISAKIAGTSLSHLDARGLARAGYAIPAAIGGIGLATANPVAIAAAVAQAAGQFALQSPKVMGGLAIGAGRAANYLTAKPLRDAVKNYLIR